MRILQIVAVAGGNDAFGGPASIAREQCAELARRGHAVTLAAGCEGGRPHLGGSGVRSRLFDVRRPPGTSGSAELLSPGLLQFLEREAAGFDLAHVHLGRDLITQGAARALRRAGARYVVQTHGMISPDARLRALALDRLATRRSLDAAAALLALDPAEAEDVALVAAPVAVRDKTVLLPPGIRPRRVLRRPPRLPGSRPEVLFVGPVDPGHRVLLFVETAAALRGHPRRPAFAIVGPDHGELDAARARIRVLGLEGTVRYAGSVPPHAVGDRMAGADVVVVPSATGPAGMIALEALAAGTPVVMADTGGLAADLRARGAALVCPPRPDLLAGAVAQALREPCRRSLVTAGHRAISSVHGIAAVADRLEEVYRAALPGARARVTSHVR